LLKTTPDLKYADTESHTLKKITKQTCSGSMIARKHDVIGCRQNLREAVNDRFRISPSNNATYEV
jgi:hypothetical protein